MEYLKILNKSKRRKERRNKVTEIMWDKANRWEKTNSKMVGVNSTSISILNVIGLNTPITMQRL